jgi:hypothetical protein
MEAFVAYRPFAFEMSTTQELANAISLSALALCMLILIAAFVVWLRGRIRGGTRRVVLGQP